MKLWHYVMLIWLFIVGYLAFKDKSIEGFSIAIFNTITSVLTWSVIFVLGMAIYEAIVKYKKRRELQDEEETQKKINKYYKEAKEEELEKTSNELVIKKVQTKFITRILKFFKST